MPPIPHGLQPWASTCFRTKHAPFSHGHKHWAAAYKGSQRCCTNMAHHPWHSQHKIPHFSWPALQTRTASLMVGQGETWDDQDPREDEPDELDELEDLNYKQAMLQEMLGPSRAQLNEFQALWADYGRELQLSKETVAIISTQVQKGLLPCDAPALKARTLALLKLETKIPGLRPRYLLARSSATLRMHPGLIAAAARRLTKLLPDRPLHSLLALLMPLLGDSDVDVLVCELLELEHVLRPVWGQASVPARLAQLWLAQQAAQYKSADQQFWQQRQHQASLAKARYKAEHRAAASSVGRAREQSTARVDAPSPSTAADSSVTSTASSGSDQVMTVMSTPQPGNVRHWAMSGLGAASGGSRKHASSRPTLPAPPIDETVHMLQLVRQLPSEQAVEGMAAASSSSFVGPPGSMGPRIRDAEQTHSTYTLDLIQEACQGLVQLLGSEPAYSVVRKAAQLIHAPGDQLADSFAALQASLKVSPVAAALLVESEPKLLTIRADAFSAQLTSLQIALGWKLPDVCSLVLSCPRVMLASPMAVNSQWRQLQVHSVGRPDWAALVSKAPAYCLALLLNRPDPGQCLARLKYLSHHPRDMQRTPLERVLKLTQPAFLQQCPGYLRRQRHPRYRHTPRTGTGDDPSSQGSLNSSALSLHANQLRLERLLASEGIELVGSGPPATCHTIPDVAVDWSRYHIQLLFVDKTDTTRGRIAAGIFDRIAEWNGFGRAMYTWTCGLETQAPLASSLTSTPASAPPSTHHCSGESNQHSSSSDDSNGMSADDLPPPSDSTLHTFSSSHSRTAAVLSAATALKLSVRDVARPAEQFELDDLDRYDLVVCLDRSIWDAIMSQLSPSDQEYYRAKVVLLTSFSRYECDATVLARGGFALLPMQLSFLLRTGSMDMSSLKGHDDISSPQLSGEAAAEEWSSMVQVLIWCTAGLVKYLMDVMPEDQHWDPQD